ncbi:SLBB domain-containing protein [Ghiorsea bivora]|uniref:SLBB domain-containing protein n=1 Tax=Ghiorsea bivora TaxID=1485545 RepID=UPI00056E686B|nr:SLBB domain-containing protein [Ghiorsea bivora]
MQNIIRLFFFITMGLVSMANAHGASLSADQLRMVEQLSPQDKASLAKQYGVNIPSKPSSVAITNPETVAPRAVGRGILESGPVKSADAKKIEQDVAQSSQVEMPIEKTGGQQGADKIELKRAFSDFVRESKPLQVNTNNLKQFGYDLFAGAPTTFAPATDVPVPAEYVLGPGDELEIQLFGQQNDVFTLVVDREGSVAFPNIGPLTLAGLSFSEAKAFLAEQVGDKMVGVSASVSMGKLRSIRVFALGEVERPGSYVVSGLATLSHALFVSGGVKKIGSLRRVQLKRQGKLVSTLDLYDFLLNGDTSKDVRLLPGDVVFVPPIGKTASIAGAVVRPAIYELKGRTNVAAMVHLAGGFLPKAYHEEALLERINDTGNKSVKSFTLYGKGLKTVVQNGDVIKVFSSLDFEENPVMLIGNVKRPGKYAWKQGMHLKDLVKNEQALLPETFMDYGLIEREAEGNREPELLRFNVRALLTQGGDDNVLLKPRDKVFIFHRSHFRIAPKVKVVGSVQTPGDYALKKNMRMLDLVLAAGGLLRDASLGKVELYRTNPNTHDVSMLKVSLDQVMQGDKAANLDLQDLDRLVVHSVWEKKRKYSVQITGEVMNPKEYTFVDTGMRLTDLVFAAGGVTEKAMLGKVEITRFDIIDGKARESKHFDVDLAKALAGDESANIMLQAHDVVTIRQVSNWRASEHVTLAGEFLYPGSYPVEDGEKLSDLIERSGGFSDKAYLKAAVFTRESIRQEQQKQIDEMTSRMEVEIAQEEQAIASLGDAQLIKHKQAALLAAKRVLEQMKATKALGRLVIKLEDIRKLKKSDFNLTLRDGDQLYVPKKPDQVMVVGQVYNTTALLYRKKYDLEDYVGAAGGMTRFADEDRVYVVRANGFVERASAWGSTYIHPGDAIIVPEKLEQFSLLDSTLDWSRVLMQVGVGLASMKTIGIF